MLPEGYKNRLKDALRLTEIGRYMRRGSGKAIQGRVEAAAPQAGEDHGGVQEITVRK